MINGISLFYNIRNTENVDILTHIKMKFENKNPVVFSFDDHVGFRKQ